MSKPPRIKFQGGFYFGPLCRTRTYNLVIRSDLLYPVELREFMGYLEGNAKKYMHRYRYKGKPVEDLRKAGWYLDRLIDEMEGS